MLLQPIITKLSLPVQKRIWGLMEGSYASMEHGRSHDFDELREYIPGDEVRDIDWKASMRCRKMLVKTYHAERRHNVVFIVNTGQEMLGATTTDLSKRQLAVNVTGALAYIATKHGDTTTVVYGDSESGVKRFPTKSNLVHVEHLLRAVDAEIKAAAAAGDVETLLESVRKTHSRKAILVVVTDDTAPSSTMMALLKRLKAQHDIYWFAVKDIIDTVGVARAVNEFGTMTVPEWMLGDDELIQELSASTDRQHQALRRQFLGLGIPFSVIDPRDYQQSIINTLTEASLRRG